MSDPFTSLLDLDGTHRPGLRLRLDGEEYVLRAPEELSLHDAFVLGGAFERLRQAAGDPGRFEATARGSWRSSRRRCPSSWPEAGVDPGGVLRRPRGGRRRTADDPGGRPRPFLRAGAGFVAAARIAARFGLGLREQLAMPVAEWAAHVAALEVVEASEQLARIEAAAWPWRDPAEQRRTLRRLAVAAGEAAPDIDAADGLDGMAVRREPSGANE